jgi:hypothetical protein
VAVAPLRQRLGARVRHVARANRCRRALAPLGALLELQPGERGALVLDHGAHLRRRERRPRALVVAWRAQQDRGRGQQHGVVPEQRAEVVADEVDGGHPGAVALGRHDRHRRAAASARRAKRNGGPGPRRAC